MSTPIGLNDMRTRSPLINALPGELAPFAIQSGLAQRHIQCPWLFEFIARYADTADEFTLTRTAAPSGRPTQFLSTAGHTFLHVLEGELLVWLAGGTSHLVPGGFCAGAAGRAVFNLTGRRGEYIPAVHH